MDVILERVWASLLREIHPAAFDGCGGRTVFQKQFAGCASPDGVVVWTRHLMHFFERFVSICALATREMRVHLTRRAALRCWVERRKMVSDSEWSMSSVWARHLLRPMHYPSRNARGIKLPNARKKLLATADV